MSSEHPYPTLIWLSASFTLSEEPALVKGRNGLRHFAHGRRPKPLGEKDLAKGTASGHEKASWSLPHGGYSKSCFLDTGWEAGAEGAKPSLLPDPRKV